MILVGDRGWLVIGGVVSILSGVSSSAQLGWVAMSRVYASCSCDVRVSLILNIEDLDICDNCKILTRTGVGTSSTGGSIIVEIGSREREKVCLCHTGSSITISVSIVRR